jgi:leucine dehydrogenase
LTFAGVPVTPEQPRPRAKESPPRPTATSALVRRGSAESLPSGAISDRYLEPLAHETLLVRRGRRSGLFTMAAVHSTARGPALGGCRMWTYDDARAAVRDVLRLSRAMTFKAAVAGLPLGGGKGVIMLRREAVLLDFGDTVDALDGAYLTAEDVGTSEPDMATIARQTRYVTGLSTGSGDPSPWTALGCEAAIRVTAERVFGSDDLHGRSIAVIGAGHVGGPLAELLHEAGAELLLADIDPRKRELAERLGAQWTDPGRALTADVDIVAPCALGGVLNHDTVPQLHCRAIAGAANNQLAAEELADALAARGILWAPDFVCNAGGIINIVVELEPEGYAPERAEPRVRAVGDTLREIFDAAESESVTPLAAALALGRRRLAGEELASGADA